MPLKCIFFLCAVFATISLANTTANNDGPKHRTKKISNADSMEEMGSFPLHSYMKQIYHKRARGNGNGSFTVSLRNQKILATSIRGFEPEKNGTTWKRSTVNMQFRLGNVFVDDVVVEAELIFTSKISRMSRKFNVSVYADQPVLAPNGSRRVVSRAFPRRANVQFGLNMTLAIKAWSLSSERIYNLKVRVEYQSKHNSSTAYVLNAWRYFKHGHEHGPFLVLYTQFKHPNSREDIWKFVMLNPLALSSKSENTTNARDSSDVMQGEIPGASDGRTPRNPILICYQVSFAIKMRDFYRNVIVPHNGFLNYCDGYCHYPIQNHLTPTIHAVIWAMWWKRNSANAYTPKKPLCVPTKLASQPVILRDPETGQPIQKEWPKFSAKECGCR